MRGPEGTGEDIIAAIREFAGKGLIHQVHLRNIDQPLPRFVEILPDDGQLDLASIVRTLVESGFNGMTVPDHIRIPLESSANQQTMETFSLRFIRGLLSSSTGGHSTT